MQRDDHRSADCETTAHGAGTLYIALQDNDDIKGTIPNVRMMRLSHTGCDEVPCDTCWDTARMPAFCLRLAGGRAYAYDSKVNPGYSSTSRKNQQLTRMIQVTALNTVRRHCGFHLPPVNTLMNPMSNPINTMMAT